MIEEFLQLRLLNYTIYAIVGFNTTKHTYVFIPFMRPINLP